MTEPSIDPAAKEPAAETKQPAQPSKAPPETLTLRANPRRVVRFKREVIIGGAAASLLAIAAVAWWALGSETLQIVAAGDDKSIANRHTPADEVISLPSTYSEVAPGTPVLGPPLPGDLGR